MFLLSILFVFVYTPSELFPIKFKYSPTHKHWRLSATCCYPVLSCAPYAIISVCPFYSLTMTLTPYLWRYWLFGSFCWCNVFSKLLLKCATTKAVWYLEYTKIRTHFPFGEFLHKKFTHLSEGLLANRRNADKRLQKRVCLCVRFYVNETYGLVVVGEWSNDFLQRKCTFLCFLSFLRFCIWCLTVILLSPYFALYKSIANPFRVSNILVLCCIQIFVLYYERMGKEMIVIVYKAFTYDIIIILVQYKYFTSLWTCLSSHTSWPLDVLSKVCERACDWYAELA